jgi:anaphase-promoting complex subunit 2
MRTTLTNMLISEINTRLTHHGADTRDILTHYVTMVKYLRILDPSGAILEHAAQPVREYLR